VFEEAIEAFLLQNGHRVTVCMEPDVTLEEKQQKAETDKLAQIKAGMSDDDLEKVIEVRDGDTQSLIMDINDSPIPTEQSVLHHVL
jgi:Zn-dependent M16 (insulinase) family peptidase